MAEVGPKGEIAGIAYMIAQIRKKMFAYQLNYKYKEIGKKVINVYLVVLI